MINNKIIVAEKSKTAIWYYTLLNNHPKNLL